jgi:hypothetical protein
MNKFLLLPLIFLFSSVSHAEISQSATLAEKVPSNAAAYFRVPNFWGWVASPKGNSLSKALASPALQEELFKLKSAVDSNILVPMSAHSGSALRLFLTQMNAPLEAMVVMPKQGPQPSLPSIVIKTRLGISTLEEFNKILTTFVEETPQVTLLSSTSDKGEAVLNVGIASLLVNFDAATGQLDMMAGQGISQTSLNQYRSLSVQENLSLRTAEHEIDNSGQGLLFWLNAKQILPLVKGFMLPEEQATLKSLGLMDIESIAIGSGVANGKGRLKAMLTGPRTELQSHFPGVNNQFSVTAAGTPGGVASISLFSVEFLTGMEELLRKLAPETFLEYSESQQVMKEQLGFTLKNLLDAIGPEILIFSDEVGEYLAIKLKNSEKFQSILSLLKQKFNLTLNTTVLNNKQHYHLIIPGMKPADDIEANSVENMINEIFSQSNSHLYWIEDSGYLLFAQVPQMLDDHHHAPTHISIDDWIQQTQKQNPRHALSLISLTMPKIPRQVYYAYLQLLTFLGDLAMQPIDIYALPGANQLALPSHGAFGMQFDMGDDMLALSFNYESSLFEFMLDPGMGTVAAAGIVAAVAIPAYNDYTTRAKVVEGLYSASPHKAAITEYFHSHDKFPDSLNGVGLPPHAQDDNINLRENGIIQIEFSESSLQNQSLLLVPKINQGAIHWQCRSDSISPKHLPVACR